MAETQVNHEVLLCAGCANHWNETGLDDADECPVCELQARAVEAETERDRARHLAMMVARDHGIAEDERDKLRAALREWAEEGCETPWASEPYECGKRVPFDPCGPCRAESICDCPEDPATLEEG